MRVGRTLDRSASDLPAHTTQAGFPVQFVSQRAQMDSMCPHDGSTLLMSCCRTSSEVFLGRAASRAAMCFDMPSSLFSSLPLSSDSGSLGRVA